MKAARALDMSGDGRISEDEFKRLYNPVVIVAAEVKVRADLLWASSHKDSKGRVQRLQCWDAILADDELSYIIGAGSTSKGKE